MTHCVFSLGPLRGVGEYEALRQLLIAEQFSVVEMESAHKQSILVVECPKAEVSRFFLIIGETPYMSSTGENMVTTKNALNEYWSRKARAQWHANEDWFQSQKHLYKQGDFIVVRNAALALRTQDKMLACQFLQTSPDPSTAFHEMVGDGVEAQLYL